MNRPARPVLAALLASLLCAPAFADDDDDDRRGWRHRGGHEYKERYWEGGCRVEREYRRDGSYKVERDCGGRRRGYGPGHGYGPGWGYGPWGYGPGYGYGPAYGSPAVVIQPPAIVIR